MRRALFIVFAFLLAATASGCGKKNVRVTGRISKSGQPIKISDKGRIQLFFMQLDDQGTPINSYVATVQPDGSFEVTGDPGRGMPPGKYKITVEAPDPYPAGKDLLGGRFKLNGSPWTRDVKDGAHIELDVDKPEAGGGYGGGGGNVLGTAPQGPRPGRPR